MSANSPAFSESLKHQFHARLTRFNAARLSPALPHDSWSGELRNECAMRIEEGQFIEQERARISARAGAAPTDVDAFMPWFEELQESGPGQGDPLFAWLATDARRPDMQWFLTQEAAGEAGFEDLVAMTQVRMPARPKLEMAANYWDEMGRGHERGMHGPMLDTVVRLLNLQPQVDTTVWESLALSNLMVGLATSRRYAWQSVGALGVIEMTAPARVALVNAGMLRLGLPVQARKYFQLHAGLDIKHSASWNEEVIRPLAARDPRIATAIAEGALMRLSAGEACFKRYRSHLAVAG
ncbi:hypothetical protein BH11PSE7_BH11PSE7_20260 [soil metagenome]